MAIWIDYILDVLAGSPAEIDQVSERLNKLSRNSQGGLSASSGTPWMMLKTFLQQLLTFKTDQDLRFLHSGGQQGTAVHPRIQKVPGIVNSHLVEVSEAFPRAVFLTEYYEMQ